MTDTTLQGIRFRAAHEQESSALTLIANKSKAHWGYPAADIARWQDDLRISSESIAEGLTFAAECGTQLAGCYQLCQDAEAAPESITLELFWVDPDWMGKGIGRAMLEHAATQSRERGCQLMHIDADPNAEGFYSACGARRVGEVLAPTEDQADRVRPQMILDL